MEMTWVWVLLAFFLGPAVLSIVMVAGVTAFLILLAPWVILWESLFERDPAPPDQYRDVP